MTRHRRHFLGTLLILAALPLVAHGATTYRLYDGITLFVNNPDGRAFEVTVDVQDLNLRVPGPSDLLVKVYPPDGRPVVRDIVPDDGIVGHASGLPATGWDHEAWYYATCYSRGLEPLLRWSAFSDPVRLAAVPKRTFTYAIEGGQKGVYRILLVGMPDHYVTVNVTPQLAFGVAGSPEWLHGQGELYKRSYLYVPRTTKTINLQFLQLDEPASRTFTLRAPDGSLLAGGNGGDGLVRTSVECEGARDEQVLTLEVSDAPGDYLLNVTFQIDNDFKPVRAPYQAVTAVLCADAQTATAIQGGAIYHDGQVFWQMHQVRLHDWLAGLAAKDFEYPAALNDKTGFISVGSHNSPRFDSPKKPALAVSDLIMHSWAKHKNPQALNAAIKDMLFGLRLLSHGDHVAIGPNRNLAYEMGCYTFFWWRPAWRIIQQSDAPEAVKDILREFVIQGGDRLAFSRTMATGNGNAFASLMAGVRYCAEASQDPMQKALFDTIWERFSTGGYGDRVGIGPSGGLQESLGYDFHYGSYVLRGWRAVMADLKEQRIIDAYDRMLNLYSYIWFQGPAGNPWSSRTSITSPCGGAYNAWHPRFSWKGHGGPDLTVGVNDHNEWFAARRPTYYMVTYHGRLTPTWEGEGFHGQIGLGGGTICQLHIPGKGQVLSGKPNGSYGSGMHLSQWHNFHVHSLVGTTTDGKPLVAANSEHFNAKLDGNTVTSSGPVRQSSVSVSRTYEYGPTAIRCEVSLSNAVHDSVFALWGGRPSMRGKVAEAYEMIPFVDTAKPKGKPRRQDNHTGVRLLGENGAVVTSLTDESVGKPGIAAAGVVIDRGGYGALIEFDETRPVERGKNDTILVQLVTDPTPASEVAFSYHIVPYVGDPPKLGALAGASREKIPLVLLAEVDAVGKVAEALAGVAPAEIKADDQVIATLRLGVAGDCLVLLADVKDETVSRHAQAWRASCLEVFGSKPNSFSIGQVFLTPAKGEQPAAGFCPSDGGEALEPRIQASSEPTDGGYKLSALIPLDLLRLAPEDMDALLEFQISSQRAGKKRTYTTLFGSERAYERNVKYGLFSTEPAPENGSQP